MDLRRLVRRIAEVLGPDATPERVERIAIALMDEQLDLGGSASSLPAGPSPEGSRAIVTAYGKDAPGILSMVTNVVAGAGCNILDVSQKILQDYFTLIMLVDTSGLRGSMSDLQKQLSEAGAKQRVRVQMQHEELFNAMHRI